MPRPHQRVRSARQIALAAIARETQFALPGILAQLPQIRADESEFLDLARGDLPPLESNDCPKIGRKATIRVVNEDTFNAAIDLAGRQAATSTASGRALGSVLGGNRATPDRVAVLNLASDKTPGGGWLNGATAQEEALCYRSSLALSLHKRHYPWRATQGLYTRDVVIIRGAMDQGHALLTNSNGITATDLPVVSVLSIAGLRRPERTVLNIIDAASGGLRRKEVFERVSDREMTKMKMRMTLRMAARRGHTLLVLGALGCGAFQNPVEDVAECWLEVLREEEFTGGWWKEMWFAVYDRRNEGNYEVFDRILGGKEV